MFLYYKNGLKTLELDTIINKIVTRAYQYNSLSWSSYSVTHTLNCIHERSFKLNNIYIHYLQRRLIYSYFKVNSKQSTTTKANKQTPLRVLALSRKTCTHTYKHTRIHTSTCLQDFWTWLSNIEFISIIIVDICMPKIATWLLKTYLWPTYNRF